MILAEALLQGLKDHGAKQIFGIPGDFALPFFKVIESTELLPLVTLSHEPGIGFAADAAARISGNIGVAAVTYGAGAFNMVNSVTCAYAEKSPLVVISGAPGLNETQQGLLLHHQAKTLNSQYQIFKEITCDQVILDNPKTASEDIARVLQSCIEQSRPVYIEFPRDQIDVEVDAVENLGQHASNPEALSACADEIESRIMAAKKPIILAGVEVRRYALEDAVAELSRNLQLPVATSFMGRGLFSNSECHFLGCYLGMAGDESIQAAVEDSDLVIMLGTIMSDTNFGVSAKKLDLRHIINAVDRQVNIGFHHYEDLALTELVDTLVKRSKTSDAHPTPAKQDYPRKLTADDQAIEPTDIARAVNDLFDKVGPMPIASDIGDCLFTALDMDNTQLIAPGYYATMGFGVPAGLGLQAETNERPIILVGDGAFQMTGWELGNCRRYGWDPIVLLFNNCTWGMLATFQPEAKYNHLGDWEYANIATTLGGDSYRVTTRQQLEDALQTASETRGKFQLIEIMLEPDARSTTLQRFIAAQKKRTAKRD